MKQWQTFASMTCMGIEVGIALYDGPDATFELVYPTSKALSVDDANAILATLDTIVATLNRAQP